MLFLKKSKEIKELTYKVAQERAAVELELHRAKSEASSWKQRYENLEDEVLRKKNAENSDTGRLLDMESSINLFKNDNDRLKKLLDDKNQELIQFKTNSIDADRRNKAEAFADHPQGKENELLRKNQNFVRG